MVVVVVIYYSSICLSASLKTKLFCETSSIFEFDNIKNCRNFCETSSITSNPKQFCETSSIFEVGKIKNEAILRDSPQKWKVECRADGPIPLRFAIFPFHLSKVLRLPRESDARSSTVSRFPVPHVSFVLRLPREMHLSRSSSNATRLPSFLEMAQNISKPSRFAHF